MVFKGQVEFIIVFALLLIGAVAAYVALQNVSVQPPPPSGIAEEVKTVKDSVNNLITAAVQDQMGELYASGGVINPSSGESVKFGQVRVRLWSTCSEIDLPSIRMELEDGIANYIKYNLQDQGEFFGKDVDFDLDRLDVDVNILQDRIDVTVDLPTEVEEYSVPQPYTASVSTRLHDIMEFGHDFVNYLDSSEFFEYATLDSIYNSDSESPDWMPMVNMQTGCGNVLTKTRQDLLNSMEKMIKAVVISTAWNEVPVYGDDPVYALAEINGRMYPEIDLDMDSPVKYGDWDLESNFAVTPAPPIIVEPTRVIPFLDVCVVPVAVMYSVRYPMVFSVRDTETGEFFNFATMVCIDRNKPSEGELDVLGNEEYARECIEESNCHYRINVSDSEGKPVEGATIIYDICDLGETDSEGISEGDGPCLTLGQLNVYAPGYRNHGEVAGSGDLAYLNITLKEVAGEVSVYFYGVNTIAGDSLGSGDFDGYTVSGSPAKITATGNYIVSSKFEPVNPNRYSGDQYSVMLNNIDSGNELQDSVTETGFYPKEFTVYSEVFDNSTQQRVGVTEGTFTFSEGDEEVYVYVPVAEGISGSINKTEASEMTSALASCGIAPVSSGEQEVSC